MKRLIYYRRGNQVERNNIVHIFMPSQLYMLYFISDSDRKVCCMLYCYTLSDIMYNRNLLRSNNLDAVVSEL